MYNRKNPLKINNLAARQRGSKIVGCFKIINKINDLQILLRGSKVALARVLSRSLRGSKIVGSCAGRPKNPELFTKAWVKGRFFAILRGSNVL